MILIDHKFKNQKNDHFCPHQQARKMEKYLNTKINQIFKIIQLTIMKKHKFNQKMNQLKKNSKIYYLNTGFHKKIKK